MAAPRLTIDLHGGSNVDGLLEPPIPSGLGCCHRVILVSFCRTLDLCPIYTVGCKRLDYTGGKDTLLDR